MGVYRICQPQKALRPTHLHNRKQIAWRWVWDGLGATRGWLQLRPPLRMVHPFGWALMATSRILRGLTFRARPLHPCQISHHRRPKPHIGTWHGAPNVQAWCFPFWFLFKANKLTSQQGYPAQPKHTDRSALRSPGLLCLLLCRLHCELLHVLLRLSFFPFAFSSFSPVQ